MSDYCEFCGRHVQQHAVEANPYDGRCYCISTPLDDHACPPGCAEGVWADPDDPSGTKTRGFVRAVRVQGMDAELIGEWQYETASGWPLLGGEELPKSLRARARAAAVA